GLILILTWNYVKDFVQGTIFKIQKGNIVDQSIKIETFSGVIVTMGNTKIDIQLDNGEILQYPYSKLSTQIIRTATNVKYFKNCIFNISVPLPVEIDKLKQQILVHLLDSPWVVSTMRIKIEIVGQESEMINIKINAYTLDEKFIPKIQNSLAGIIKADWMPQTPLSTTTIKTH
nr:mechanosensitive ion channel [Bacteroidales bacterium]